MLSSQNADASRPLGPTSVSLAMMTAALWGGVPVAISFSVVALPPVAVAAIRFAMAAVFMLFWCRFEKTSLRLEPGQLKLTMIAGTLLFMQISTFNFGVDWSNSSHASLLINTFVFWVVAIEHFVTKTDRVTRRKLAGLVIAALGAIVVISLTGNTADGPVPNHDLPSPQGDVMLLASAFLLGIRIVYVKQALRRIEPGKLIFWHDIFGVVLFAAYSAAAEDLTTKRMTLAAVLGLAYQGFLVAGLCFAIQTQLLRKHSASRISVFSFAMPVFGVAFAAAFRDDPLSPWLFLSVLCVAVGIFLVNAREKSPKKSKTASGALR
jgi:drug/metabolite transporter (DMT)-like permease